MDASQVKELRTGNIIESLGKITHVDYNTMYAISKLVGNSVMYKFIPLTEEWLIKFGFRKVSNVGEQQIFQGFDFEIWLNDLDIYYKESLLPLDYRYVHQLQNLYFALTGEELTLNK